MPTANPPLGDADILRDAARDLAVATRQIDDPRAIYAAVGSLSASLTALAQVLHQLGATHDDTPGSGSAGSPSPSRRSDRATSYQAAWELHRAGEMLAQVAAAVERARQLEAAITYDVHMPAHLPASASPRSKLGLSL
jgi:hypothetical protein